MLDEIIINGWRQSFNVVKSANTRMHEGGVKMGHRDGLSVVLVLK
jgi:hypothetical protein